jgi:antitoxin HigA-1
MTQYRAARVPGFAVHPGELMREILTEHLRLPIAEAARRMQISRPSLYAVLNGNGGVTADMALRFGKLTGGAPELFVQMQAQYDLFEARNKLAKTLEKIEPASAA